MLDIQIGAEPDLRPELNLLNNWGYLFVPESFGQFFFEMCATQLR